MVLVTRFISKVLSRSWLCDRDSPTVLAGDHTRELDILGSVLYGGVVWYGVVICSRVYRAIDMCVVWCCVIVYITAHIG